MRALHRGIAGLGMLCSLGACGADDDAAPTPGAADQRGGFAIGVTTLELTDEARNRPLKVELWYPARHAKGDVPGGYDVSFGGLTLATLPTTHGAVRDAAPDLRGGPYPLVLNSHGFAAVRYHNYYLSEYLATHGYVVAAPDHTGNTLEDLAGGGVDDAATAQSALDRPKDISFLIDALLARSEGEDPLLGEMIDAQAIGVTGHSFGGYTSLALAGAVMDIAGLRESCVDDADQLACMGLDFYPDDRDELSQRDARIRAAAPLAPASIAVFGDSGVRAIEQPVLVEGGSLDRTTPFDEEQQPAYDALTGPRYLLELEGAGHLSFTNVCLLLEETVGVEAAKEIAGDLASDGCTEEFVDSRVAHAAIEPVTQAFFDRYLRNDSAAEAILTPAWVAQLEKATLSADP